MVFSASSIAEAQQVNSRKPGEQDMNIVMLGPPGAGKGTQGVMLAEAFGLVAVATGDIFRAALNAGTPLGKQAKAYMERGALVPDEVVVGIVKERLKEQDCQGGFLLDGFPRTVAQAEALDEFLASSGAGITAAIAVDVDEAELVRRLSGRRVCENCGNSVHVDFEYPPSGRCQSCGGQLVQRADDREETIKERLRVYAEETAPLVGYYENQDLLVRIDGNQSKDQVFEDITHALGLHLGSSTAQK